MNLEQEEYVEVTPFTLVINESTNYLMMVFDHQGKQCITFAQYEADGVMIPALYPADFVHDCLLREHLATELRILGYWLTSQPEQLMISN